MAGPWRMMGGTRSEGAERDKEMGQELRIGMWRTAAAAVGTMEPLICVPKLLLNPWGGGPIPAVLG